MDFAQMHFGVAGDSITAGEQWSYHVYKRLGLAGHHNVAVGSSVWYKRTFSTAQGEVTTQDYTDPYFAGISDGWEPDEDPVELQKRANNCAVVHIQHFLEDVKNGITPAPDIFAFAYGTNDLIGDIGDIDKALSGKSLCDNPNIDLFTTAGAMRWCVQTVAENFPECRIFVLTPIQTGEEVHNADNRKKIEVMKKIARALSVQVIDMYGNCGISEKFEEEHGPGRYLRDGLHPDVPGQRMMGRYAASQIRANMF